MSDEDFMREMVSKFDLVVLEDDRLLGELDGIPFTLRATGSDPLATLWAFQIVGSSQGPEVPVSDDMVAWVSDGSAKIEVLKGIAWLSLYRMTSRSVADIEAFVRNVASWLKQAGVAPPSGCISCGVESGARIVTIGSCPQRICAACLGQLVAASRQAEQANEPQHVSFKLAVPLALGLSVGVWAAFWLGADALVRYFEIRRVELNQLTSLLLLLPMFALGGLAGWPLGTCLRRAGLNRIAPFPLAALTVLVTVVLGEWLYITADVFLVTGQFAPVFAFNSLPDLLQSYTGFWVGLKIVAAVAIGFGVAIGSERAGGLAVHVR